MQIFRGTFLKSLKRVERSEKSNTNDREKGLPLKGENTVRCLEVQVAQFRTNVCPAGDMTKA